MFLIHKHNMDLQTAFFFFFFKLPLINPSCHPTICITQKNELVLNATDEAEGTMTFYFFESQTWAKNELSSPKNMK